MKKIKIAHVASRLTGKEDGRFKHIIAQINLLDRARFNQILITNPGEYLEKKLKAINIRSFILPKLNYGFNPNTIVHLYKILKEENVDFICVHCLKSYVLAGLINVFLRKKLVFYHHGITIKNDYNSSLQQIIYRILHTIIKSLNKISVLSPSKNSISLIKKDMKFSNIDCYYDGEAVLNENEMDENIKNYFMKLKRNHKLLVYIGRFDREKNLYRALRIFKGALNELKNVKFLIIGNGEEKKELVSFVKENGIPNVIFVNFIENVASYFHLFDLLFITSNREGFPITVWEAMNKKLPILSTNVGGIKEVVENAKCGLIFEPNDEEDGKRKLVYLMLNDKERKILGENGYFALHKIYTKKNFKETLENFYIKSLDEKQN